MTVKELIKYLETVGEEEQVKVNLGFGEVVDVLDVEDATMIISEYETCIDLGNDN